ncbi:PEP-CTERM system TPR-repeat protein PrsT [Alteromonas sediminis]|uniref:PEP-CTERM system TPR-repeat protein PrsT n=1 Tax=Alteromonas sediminis TaxID=2259342 RepID=A0A3N5XZP0_9ALTE|nr:XrtA/PEP-CTERM system TPR-repeat protein PrsT [Alteromonas sediminis]RPJ66023.1 PEP-CTERM system TPR-repeat protein PrsT [Alteromonas sediminis]
MSVESVIQCPKISFSTVSGRELANAFGCIEKVCANSAISQLYDIMAMVAMIVNLRDTLKTKISGGQGSMLKVVSRLAVAGSVLALVACSGQTSEEHLNAARQFIQANNNNAAVLELKNALQKDPSSAVVRFELGRIYVEQGQFEGAEKELNRALELGYDSAEILPLLSVAYKRTGAQNALADLNHAETGLSSEESAKVGYYKLLALVDLQKNDEANALIDEVAALSTSSVYKGLAESYRAILNEDFAGALEQVKALRAQSPDNEDILDLLVKLHLSQQQQEEAVLVFEDMLRVNPDNVEVQFTFMALLMDMRRFEQAKPIIDKLIALSPDNGLLNQFKGIVLSSDEDYENALVHLEKALLNGNDNNIVRLLAGFAAYKTELYEDAVKHLGLLVNILPADHPGLRVLADSQLLLGQSQDATSVLDRIGGEGQSDAQLFTRAGYQLVRQGNLADAKKMVERGQEIGASSEELLQLGVLQLSLNDLSGLINLEQAAEKAPESVVTQQTLASAYLLSSQFDKAAQLAEEWKASQPDTMKPYLLAGEVAMKTDNLELAEQEFIKAGEISPDQPEPKLALISLAVVKGDKQKATQDIKSVLAEHPDNPTALTLNYLLAKEAGDTSDAINTAENSLTAFPDNEKVRLTLANIQLSERAYSDAVATLDPIEADGNTSIEYWALKGQALLRANQLDNALAHYTQWRSIAPFNKDATLGQLLILDTQLKFADALEVTEGFLEKRADTQLDVLHAYFLTMTGQVEESRKKIDGLPTEVKALPFIRGVEARIAFQDNRFADAAEHAEVAYTATPNLRNLALFVRALEASKQGEKAYSTLSAYTEKNPNDPSARMMLAERMIGRDVDNAVTLYQEALEVMPQNFIALNNLAYLYLDRGDYEKALPLAQRAVEIRPSMPEAVDTLAQVYVAQNELKRARDLYETVINNNVRNDEVALHYIELLVKMGETVLAERRVKDRKWQNLEFKAQAEALFSKS